MLKRTGTAKTYADMEVFRHFREMSLSNFLKKYAKKAGTLDENGRSLIQEAITRGRLADAAELAERGAPANVQDHNGDTALHFAADHGAADLMKVLLAHGADANLCNVHGNGPLWTAAIKGDVDMVRVLRAAGADVSHVNRVGKTPLDIAATFSKPEYNKPELMRALTE